MLSESHVPRIFIIFKITSDENKKALEEDAALVRRTEDLNVKIQKTNADLEQSIKERRETLDEIAAMGIPALNRSSPACLCRIYRVRSPEGDLLYIGMDREQAEKAAENCEGSSVNYLGK